MTDLEKNMIRIGAGAVIISQCEPLGADGGFSTLYGMTGMFAGGALWGLGLGMVLRDILRGWTK